MVSRKDFQLDHLAPNPLTLLAPLSARPGEKRPKSNLFLPFGNLLVLVGTFGCLETHLLSVNPLRHVSLHRVPDLQIKFEFISKQVKYNLSTVENREKWKIWKCRTGKIWIGAISGRWWNQMKDDQLLVSIDQSPWCACEEPSFWSEKKNFVRSSCLALMF